MHVQLSEEEINSDNKLNSDIPFRKNPLSQYF